MHIVDISHAKEAEDSFTVVVVYKDGSIEEYTKTQGIDFEFSPEAYAVVLEDGSLVVILHHSVSCLRLHKECL